MHGMVLGSGLRGSLIRYTTLPWNTPQLSDPSAQFFDGTPDAAAMSGTPCLGACIPAGGTDRLAGSKALAKPATKCCNSGQLVLRIDHRGVAELNEGLLCLAEPPLQLEQDSSSS